jgi:hypothetical protein
MRLCSREELESDKCCGTGCNMDLTRIWSSTVSTVEQVETTDEHPSGVMNEYESGKICSGTVGKKGVKYLMTEDATADTCKMACLLEPKCNFAVFTDHHKKSEAKCLSFVRCKRPTVSELSTIFKKASL